MEKDGHTEWAVARGPTQAADPGQNDGADLFTATRGDGVQPGSPNAGWARTADEQPIKSRVCLFLAGDLPAIAPWDTG